MTVPLLQDICVETVAWRMPYEVQFTCESCQRYLLAVKMRGLCCRDGAAVHCCCCCTLLLLLLPCRAAASVLLLLREYHRACCFSTVLTL
jgi:hypothetical protein